MTSIGKRGLGKGLDSMIPTKANVEKKEEIKTKDHEAEVMIEVNDIEPNRSQPRRNFNEDSLQELSDSIKQYGIIQPLILQKRETYYEIIAGERRWRAARLAGLKTVPAIIKDYTEKEILEISLIENIQRDNLNPIEEALAYQRLIEEFQLKQDEVAERVSKSRTAITNCMRLLKLDEIVQQMIIEEVITSGHARALIPIEDREMQVAIATKIMDEKLSVREVEKLVKKILENKPAQDKIKDTANDVIYKDLEEKIKSIIGTKVTINKRSDNKGKIEIEYYSNEELDRIIDMMMTMEKDI